MEVLTVSQGELEALEEGRAFADLSSFRKVLVTGGDARAWLHDLVTADVDSLTEGRAARTLLLSPLGRVRGDFMVACTADGFLLIQDDAQPTGVQELLSPYVLSSDVGLYDQTESHVLVSVIGPAANRVGWPGTRPSVLGPGEDLVATTKSAWKIETMMMKKQLTEVGRQAADIWRIRRGVPRFLVDYAEDSLPAEAGLEDLIDFTKGCFLGQESVARVRNLGHPRKVLRHLVSDFPIPAGAHVFAGRARVGEVTSSAPDRDGSILIARVGWEAAEAPLTAMGAALRHPGEPLLISL